ncbi:flagellar protein FliT [Thermaerobacillus caldiproteolyticus]|uniref:Flagellar protein FliT n=1 Tax=Thermaerobacillus caldiproteolyticus TaxID=247480 RepID=A0A7W0BXK3_9BACL|nr:flagellar protein FliT [Anoxybacillus caldiproteolyticus]MBA2874641.1 flagellar protein FliT [Anoxybacillus caldiproteolyticus]
MDLVEELASCSEKLLSILQHSAIGREVQIEQINELLTKRESIIEKLKQAKTNDLEKHPKAAQIVKMEQEIKKGLHQLFTLIKKNIKELNEKKRFHQSYVNPYTHLQTVDGRFYDKRR